MRCDDTPENAPRQIDESNGVKVQCADPLDRRTEQLRSDAIRDTREILTWAQTQMFLEMFGWGGAGSTLVPPTRLAESVEQARPTALAIEAEFRRSRDGVGEVDGASEEGGPAEA